MGHGDDGLRLVREARRAGDALSPYNDEAVRRVLQEMNELFDVAMTLLRQFQGDDLQTVTPLIAYYNLVIRRDKRCLAAYLKHRTDCIRRLSWQVGAVPHEEVRQQMSARELEFMRGYNQLITQYRMHFLDLDLNSSLLPPKELFVEVRVLEDCGRIQTEYGTVNLVKNSQHYLRRTDVERLVQQGYLKHLDY